MSSYIMELRKLVGSRTLLQAAAGILVEDPQGRLLLELRKDNGCWGCCGGSVELDEEVESAARRELLEETGITAGTLSFFGVFSGKDSHYTYPNGDDTSNIQIMFLCRDWTGDRACQAEEVETLRFFSPEEIPENLTSSHKRIVEKWVFGKVQPPISPMRQRALSGKLFDAHCPELIAIKHRTHNLCQDYNATREDDPRRQDLIREIVSEIGENSYFQGPIQFNYGCNTSVGSSCYFNFNLTVLDDGPITIGDHVMIAPNVSLMASSHPLLYEERENLTYPDGHTSMSEYARGITIGNHVWICTGSIICGGVTIGDGAVIGAGSVVTKDIPAGYLACGNPCRPIRPISQKDSKMGLI